MKLRDYQVEKRDEALEIMAKCGIVYIAGEVRTGKNLIALSMVAELKYRRCLVVTKNSAVSGINGDYRGFGFNFVLDIITFGSLHKVKNQYDIIIIDEAHSLGAFPKPSKRAIQCKELFYEKPIIFLSGTPNPESWSQLYHQLYISIYSPWSDFVTFYKWKNIYVDVKERMINGFRVNDYKKGREELIKPDIEHLMVMLSQQKAGFTAFVQETVIKVAIKPDIYKLMKVLKKNKFYKMKSGDVILADTPVRMMSVFHQLSSGTIKTEEGNRYTLDTSKAVFIKKHFAGKKIAIYYKFIAEGNLLRKYFPHNTQSPEEFNNRNDLVFIKQVVSGREGVDLSTADWLVMYNIDFSATSYWQVRARMQTKTRTKAAQLCWVFSDKGIEPKVYGVVKGKKNFTTYYFKKEYGS